jgi:hypothetical protein
LNGVEVFRSNLPAGAVNHQTLASATVGGAEENTFYSQSVDPAVLVTGENVLAVEVHQTIGNSSDLSFDLELEAEAFTVNQPPVVDAGADQEADLAAGVELNGWVTDDGLPIPPGLLTNQWTQVSGPGTVSFGNPVMASTVASFSLEGNYTLRLSVGDGAFVSSDDIMVSVSGDALAAWKQQHFNEAELEDPAISGNGADPDGDGLTNYEEFIARTDPRDEESRLEIAAIEMLAGNGVELRFEAVAGRSYSVLHRDSLDAGPWNRLGDVEPVATTQMVVVEDPDNPGAAVRYYRLVTPAID